MRPLVLAFVCLASQAHALELIRVSPQAWRRAQQANAERQRMRPRRLEVHLGPRLDLRAPGNPTIEPAAKPIVERLRSTQDPNGVFGKLRAVKMRLQFNGVLFDKFTDTPGRYDGHTIEVTNYPKDQTTVWHDFPLPGRALVYSRLPTGREKLLLVREQAGELQIEAQIDEPLDNL